MSKVMVDALALCLRVVSRRLSSLLEHNFHIKSLYPCIGWAPIPPQPLPACFKTHIFSTWGHIGPFCVGRTCLQIERVEDYILIDSISQFNLDIEAGVDFEGPFRVSDGAYQQKSSIDNLCSLKLHRIRLSHMNCNNGLHP